MSAYYRFSASPVRGPILRVAAYIAGARYCCARTGAVFDFRSRQTADRDEVRYSALLLPSAASVDAETLWARVARKNRHREAVYGRMVIAAFPHWLTFEQMVEQARRYGESLAARYGVAVQFAVHAPRPLPFEYPDGRNGLSELEPETNNNWHVHFLLSYCTVDAEGNLGNKQPAIDPVSSRCLKLPNFCDVERPRWAAAMNEALQEIASPHRVDHRSNADRGLIEEPTIHLGPERWALESMGMPTQIGNHNRQVRARNASQHRLVEHARRLEDAARVLAAAREDGLTIRPHARFKAKQSWGLRTSTVSHLKTLEYFKRNVGVVATQDGGRFVDFGDRYLVVFEGARGEIFALMRARSESTDARGFDLSGPPSMVAQARLACGQPAATLLEEGMQHDRRALFPNWLPAESALALSHRRSAAIASLGSSYRKEPAVLPDDAGIRRLDRGTSSKPNGITPSYDDRAPTGLNDPSSDGNE